MTRCPCLAFDPIDPGSDECECGHMIDEHQDSVTMPCEVEMGVPLL